MASATLKKIFANLLVLRHQNQTLCMLYKYLAVTVLLYPPQTSQRPKVVLTFEFLAFRHSFPATAMMENNPPKNITTSIAIPVIKTIAIFRTRFSYVPTACC